VIVEIDQVSGALPSRFGQNILHVVKLTAILWLDKTEYAKPAYAKKYLKHS
jgi:hypothetical protein